MYLYVLHVNILYVTNNCYGVSKNTLDSFVNVFVCLFSIVIRVFLIYFFFYTISCSVSLLL